MLDAPTRIFPRWLVASAVFAVLGVVVYALRDVLSPIFFALLIAYMLDPVVDRLEAMRIPRGAGIVIVLGVALSALALFLLLAIPSIVSDVAGFAQELPAKLSALRMEWEPYLASRGVMIPHSIDEALSQMQVDSRELASEAMGPAGTAVKWLVGGTASALGTIAGLLVVPVLAFYFLHDFDRMTAAVHDLLPHRLRPFIVDVAKEIDQVIGQFIRGQLTVMLILAVLYAVGYSVVGVRLAVVIGIVAGALAFIPYVGGAVAIGLALLMCLLDFQGFDQLAWVVAVYAVVQLLESFVITPKIMGETVGLSAVWVLLALMIGGELFGFLGVLLAVPAAAVAKIFVMRAVAHYRKSPVFLSGAPGPSVAGVAGVAGGGGFLAGILAEEGLPDDPALERAKAEQTDERADGAASPRDTAPDDDPAVASEVDVPGDSRDAPQPSEPSEGSEDEEERDG